MHLKYRQDHSIPVQRSRKCLDNLGGRVPITASKTGATDLALVERHLTLVIRLQPVQQLGPIQARPPHAHGELRRATSPQPLTGDAEVLESQRVVVLDHEAELVLRTVIDWTGFILDLLASSEESGFAEGLLRDYDLLFV